MEARALHFLLRASEVGRGLLQRRRVWERVESVLSILNGFFPFLLQALSWSMPPLPYLPESNLPVWDTEPAFLSGCEITSPT